MPELFVHYVTYLAVIIENKVFPIPDEYQGIKMGITIRPIWYRLQEHLTPDERRRYFGAARFYGPSMTHELLFGLEKLILRKTKQYMLGPDSYNSECRYHVSPEIIMGICISWYKEFCKKHEGVFFELMNIDAALLERDENTEEIRHRDKSYQKQEHFKSLEEFNSIDLPKFKGYQTEAFEKMKTAYNDRFVLNKSATLLNIMCGYGKTILIQAFVYLFAREFKYVVHCTKRLALISDQISRFGRITELGFNIIELSSSRSEYCVTDDNFRALIDGNEQLLIFVSIDSFARLIPLLDRNDRILFIFDEAHNLCTEVSEQKPHPLVILNKLRKPKKIDDYTIYSTATRIDGILSPENKQICMNDPNYFNMVAIQYTDISRGIAEEFICPLRLVVKNDVNNICRLLDGQQQQISSNMKDRTSLVNCVNVLCSLYMDKTLPYPPKKTVIYTNNTNRINVLYSALSYLISVTSELSDIHIYKIYSGSGRDDLKKFMENKGRCIIINCRMLTEGIDCKDIDTIVFADPKHSEQDITQCIFRGCRFLPNKKANIVFCTDEQTFESSNKWSVLRITITMLIKYNDPNITREMLSRSKENYTKGNKDTVIKEMMTDHLIDDGIKYKILESFATDFTIRTWNDAILYVLSYKMYITAAEIFEEIEEKKLHIYSGKTPKATCQSVCGTLAENGIIGRIKGFDDIYRYFKFDKDKLIPKLNSITFASKLKDEEIFTEVEYRERYAGKYDDEHVYNPVEFYSGFTWDMLYDDSKEEYSTFEQCKLRVAEITQYICFKEKIKDINGDERIWNIVRTYDNRIPSNPKKYSVSYDQFNTDDGPFSSWCRR